MDVSTATFPRPSRPRCDGCGLPRATCLCALVVAVDNPVEVLVLQHPSEAGAAKGTVRLLSRCLARCRVVVGEAFEPAALASWLDGRSVLLYPALPEGDDVAAVAPTSGPPTRLVVLDGTWRKTLRMLHANPLLRGLPRLALEKPATGRYARLRRAPRAGQASTLEATCAALALLDPDPGRYDPLLRSLDRFVADRVARVRSPAHPAPE